MGTGSTHSGKQRTISVGILTAPRVEFCLEGGRVLTAVEQDGRVVIDGEAREEWYFRAGGQYSDTEQFAEPNPYGFDRGYIQESPDKQRDTSQPESYFTLKNVKIGKGFHWERYQDQSFPGDLKLIARYGCVIAINVVGIEDYLQCVIASEMSPTAGFEFLKAHAVISRSWLLAQLDKRDEVREGYSSVVCDTPDELVRWQDREDHEWFDFCADDHCQRYQGIPQAVIPSEVEGSRAAVNDAMIRKTKRVIGATWGQVLWYGGRVCDARFSKCCGGVLEEFKYCWENKDVPYLKYARDYECVLPDGTRKPHGLLVAGAGAAAGLDLREEKAARRWIMSSPRAFCNTRSKRLLGQVLKDYDSETKDFYRWTVEYTQQELHDIILERTGEDYGEILDLIPIERGVSGRICRLKIVGSKKTRIIGKELEIRRTLSRSHLYSSAFVVEKTPQKFIIRGAGWGHGVGLCQIGAAAMGARGYDYRTILAHYYPNSELKTLYGTPRPQNENNTFSR